MNFGIDVWIIIAFLGINLIAGLYSGRGIATIREYAIGNRNFSTATIAATIIATWISGSFFSVTISETYKNGLWFAAPLAIGHVVTLLVIGRVFGARMKYFFGSLSVAETMGAVYGKHMRSITSVATILDSIGMTALQIKVFSVLFTYFMGFSSDYATIAASSVVIIYSAFGGIKSVTFTDIIQFITFGTLIPILLLFIWQIFGSTEAITHTLQTNPNFDWHQLFNIGNPKFWPFFFIFLYCAVPGLDAAMFQRALMARSVNQIKKSFTIAAIICLFIHLFCCLIGVTVLSHNPNIEPNGLLMYIIDNYSYAGLKGLTLVGIMAMIMSTADSWINTASVTFSHDLCEPLGLKFKNELLVARIFAVVVGIAAVAMSLYVTTLLGLVLLTANFYRPIVTVPLAFAIFGLRTSKQVVFTSIVAGATTVILWRTFIQPSTGIDSVMPAMFVNLITFVGAHYLLGQPGGIWARVTTAPKVKTINNDVVLNKGKLSEFSLINYCRAHAPKLSMTYYYFAFGLLSSLIISFSIDRSVYAEHALLINGLQGIILFISTMFICHKLWPNEFRDKYIGIIWYVSVFLSLAYISSFLVLISNLSQISLVIFILNLTMIGVLLNWQATLVMIVSGASLAFMSYQYFIGGSIESEVSDLKLKIIYILFMLISFMITFLKPNQDLKEISDKKNDHLQRRVQDRDHEVQKLAELKHEFLRNINHEIRTPMTGITSLSAVLREAADSLSLEQMKNSLVQVSSSAMRLESLMRNMLDVSELNSLSYDMNKQIIDLSKVVQERIDFCSKLYLEGKEIDIIAEIKPGVHVTCDEHYIQQTLDNLIINAITYTQSGMINIKLTENENKIEFNIQDEGIGIPEDELKDIFGVFTVSSKTRNFAGGRGLGLALCKKVIELHKGRIWVQNNEQIGAIFNFILPKA